MDGNDLYTLEHYQRNLQLPLTELFPYNQMTSSLQTKLKHSSPLFITNVRDFLQSKKFGIGSYFDPIQSFNGSKLQASVHAAMGMRSQHHIRLTRLAEHG